ncbi:concanavalin A-like lectin/glucanase domain-containing protein [Lipomyces tetrasporus]|uniref:Concanavalin A-like lectin/glucanase domain-containing protein n=1 Tax=Lipomyces tetrasporus TaxID=54092 RepID=A0AAD7QTK8_9ASCO|nr:concanavalin A-like lectin/glucanase domain-containing protein [Lipomyces tetrasporus]KAJ8100761.1 concanavalin A-like lectin/glucanase domain-containing protein [Lipomyces tetrasporus]
MAASQDRSDASASTQSSTESNNENPFRTPVDSTTDVSSPSGQASQSETLGASPNASSGSGSPFPFPAQQQQHPVRSPINKGKRPVRPAQLSTATRLPLSESTASFEGLASGSRFLLRADIKRAKPAPQDPPSAVATEPSSALPLTIGGVGNSDLALQQFQSFAFTNNAETGGAWTGSYPDTVPPSPSMLQADAVSPSTSRPGTAGADTSSGGLRSRPSAVNPVPDVPPLPVTSHPRLQSAGRALSSVSMQHKPSVFFHRPSTASLRRGLPSRAGHHGTSVANIDQAGRIPTRRHFVSRRLPVGYSAEKPWLTSQARAEKLSSWIVIVSFVLGLALIGILTWVGTTEIQNYNYCTVLEDYFDKAHLNTTVWTRDVQVGGFGNGEFEWATDSANNSFVRDGRLYIVPTFTADVIGEDNMMNGYTVNLTRAGTCTSTADGDCAVRSNRSVGNMIPPIMSARLLTRNFANIRYGKVEVRAKLPRGDWLWPAIWMMPTDSVYGPWPASGEIDICESRGNDHTYGAGGNNVMSSTLHWGPTAALNRYWKTHSTLTLKHSTFTDGFHTFGLEWSDKYIMTYLDGRLRQAIYHKFATPFWTYGTFPSTYGNGSTVHDPWPGGDPQAPFDQEFYLILNVAVGGTNGWFPDNQANKPWNNDDRQTAMTSFWDARDSWQKTWGDEYDRGMVVDSVKIYSMC